MASQVDRLEDDVAEIREWAARHDEAHTADTKLLASIIDALGEHTHNAHGVKSRAFQVGYTGLIVTIAGAVIEILRRFAF